MAAISTDSPRWSPPTNIGRHRAPTAHLRLASGQPAAPHGSAARVLLVVAAVVVVMAVTVGTAAFGRVLDSQRGIPDAAAVTADAG